MEGATALVGPEGDLIMQIVKKLALVFVASAFVVGGLAGCGEKKEAKPADAVKDVKDAVKEAGK
jgi:hypothetical protein